MLLCFSSALPSCVHIVCVHTHTCATLDFVCCVLVCCRHCSPVHYFFSMFTAHHWASLSVCLPHLHPKLQLFIYNQLVRYCTDWSLPLPQHLHPALPFLTSHPMEHACVHPLGCCGCVVVNDVWLNLLTCFGVCLRLYEVFNFGKSSLGGKHLKCECLWKAAVMKWTYLLTSSIFS